VISSSQAIIAAAWSSRSPRDRRGLERYLLAASQVGIAPGAFVVFEDAPTGVQAGKSAGMRVVGVSTTIAAAELVDADLVMPDVAAYLGLDCGQRGMRGRI
jgi:hypothetical protein